MLARFARQVVSDELGAREDEGLVLEYEPAVGVGVAVVVRIGLVVEVVVVGRRFRQCLV